ncbi:MAG: excalibur calcium-binding domain-containing protein [Asticcacaulis sp.]
MGKPIALKVRKSGIGPMDYVLAVCIFVFVFIYALYGKWPLQGLLSRTEFPATAHASVPYREVTPAHTAPQPVYTAPPPAPVVTQAPVVERPQYYDARVPANCAEARARGIAPIYSHQPEYGAHMDGDGDGIACEPYYGNDDHHGSGRRRRR